MSLSLPYPYNNFSTRLLSEQAFAKTLLIFLQQHPSERKVAANYLEILVDEHGLSSHLANSLSTEILSEEIIGDKPQNDHHIYDEIQIQNKKIPTLEIENKSTCETLVSNKSTNSPQTNSDNPTHITFNSIPIPETPRLEAFSANKNHKITPLKKSKITPKTKPYSTPKKFNWLSDKGLFLGSVILVGGTLFFLSSIFGIDKFHAKPSPLKPAHTEKSSIADKPNHNTFTGEYKASNGTKEKKTERLVATEVAGESKKPITKTIEPLLSKKNENNKLSPEQANASNNFESTKMEKLFQSLAEKVSTDHIEDTLDGTHSALIIFEEMINLEPRHELVTLARQKISSAYLKKSRTFQTEKNMTQAYLYIEKAIDIQMVDE